MSNLTLEERKAERARLLYAREGLKSGTEQVAELRRALSAEVEARGPSTQGKFERRELLGAERETGHQ